MSQGLIKKEAEGMAFGQCQMECRLWRPL